MPFNHKNRFKSLSILEFQRCFATEEDCARFLFERRWPKGWTCTRCKAAKCYPIKGRKLFECAHCRYQVSITAGTVLQGTRTPLRLWFLAVFFMVTDKRGISSVGLSKQLGVSQKRAWYMLHKLRKAMTVRNGLYKLGGIVELDESFFGTPKKGGCRGRGTAKQKVLVGLSLTNEGKPLYLRLYVLPRIDRAHLIPAIKGMVAAGATVKTNGLRSYLSLEDKGYRHDRIIGAQTDLADPRWIHMAISNAKALIGGTYHGLDTAGGKHLQAYLDEYAYRYGRRHRPDTIFERCVIAVAACPVWTYHDITGTKQVRRDAKLRAA